MSSEETQPTKKRKSVSFSSEVEEIKHPIDLKRENDEAIANLEESRKQVRKARVEYAKSLGKLTKDMEDLERKSEEPCEETINELKEIADAFRDEEFSSLTMLFHNIEELKEEADFMHEKRKKHNSFELAEQKPDMICDQGDVINESYEIKKSVERLLSFAKLFDQLKED